MKLIRANRPLILTTFAAALIAGSVACGSPSAGEDVASGTVEAAVSAIGPDGATYSLPSGTILTLVAASSGTSYPLSVGMGGTSAAYAVPAGQYSATLSSVTQLLRSGDAGPQTAVTASLADAQPYEISVFAGQTTDLVFHFTAAGSGGPITFSQGAVATSVSVGFDAGASNAVGTTLQLNITSETNSVISQLTGTLTFQITGPFVPSVGQVCAPIGAATLANGSNNTGWYYLEAASQSGNGSICFAGGADATGTYADPVSGITVGTWYGQIAVMYQDSSPSWGSVASGYSGSAAFLLLGDMSTTVFDGETLNLQALSAPTTITNAASFPQYNSGWYQMNGGTVTLQVLP
jgi:hypothetical protein